MRTKTSRVSREGRFKPLPRAGNGVQLLLIQSVDHLGKQGDVVTVKRGYALNYLLPLYRPDLVLYDAGVDVHKDDALGYLQLTDAGVAARDEAVLRHCLGRDIPVVGVIGGGYSKDRAALARRHGILHHSAARVIGCSQ